MKFENFEQPPIADQNEQVKKEEQTQKEIKLEQVVTERIESAEQKVAELSEDGQKQIELVEQSINLSAKDITVVREEVDLFSRLGKIKEEVIGLLGRLKEKFSGFLAKDKISDVVEQKSEGTERPEYQQLIRELKDYLKYEQRELLRPIIEEAKRKRNQLLEAEGLFSMSKEDFGNYFSSKDFEVRADLKQGNVGDCYAVAAIHAMSCSPHFEIICRSSMKRLPDGSWQVRVPLLSENSQMITITQEEISPQWNKQFLRRGKGGKLMPDLRPRLKPVKGKEGLQVLEAAYIKAKFDTVDRLAAEGGLGDEALLKLGGENFKKYSIDSSIWNPEKEKWEYHPDLKSLDEISMACLDHYLENFDPEVHIATVSTKHEVKGLYRIKDTKKEFLVSGHAYSVSSVDREKKIISLANPWDTSKKPINFTFDQFKENFSAFRVIRIDSAKLLQNMKKVEEKVA
jgi:hypothetical protein